MKKLVLLLLMCISFSFTASAETDYSEIQTFMTNLGFIDESFDIEGSMTRSELAKVMSNFFRNDTADYSGMSYYSDVSADDVNINEINKCTNYGIFVGTSAKGTFYPNETATLDNVAVVLVKMLGYDIAANSGEYVKVGRELGLYKGTYSTNSNNHNILIMIENALEMDIIEITSYGSNPVYEKISGKTLLSEALNIVTHKGRINAVGENALTASYSVDVDEVRIGDVVAEFHDSRKIELMRNLGMRVEAYYYCEDDEYYLVHVKVLDTRSIEMDFADYIGINGDKLKYSIGDKKKSATVNSYSYIVYNNRPVNTMPQIGINGTIKLISSDNSSVYDVIIVKEFKDYVVDTYQTDKQRFVMKYSNESIELEDIEDITAYDESYLPIDLTELESGNVISVILNTTSIEIAQCKKYVYGKIESSYQENGRKYFTIDGNNYEISDRINNSLTTSIDISIYHGVEGSVMLNCMGRICAIEVSSSPTRYGYLVWVKYSHEDSTVVAKIYNSLGQFEKLNVRTRRDQINIDGRYQDYAVFISNNSSNNVFVPTLIGYKVNSKGEITNIEMPTSTARDGLYHKLTLSSDQRFRTGVNSFGSAAILSADAKIFVVPEDVSNETGYRVVSTTFFTGDARYKNLDFYGYSEKELTSPLAVYKTSNSSDNLSNGTTIIVTDIEQTLNIDDEIVYIIKGVGGASSEELTYVGAPNIELNKTTYTATASALGREVQIGVGDVIRGRYSQADSNYYQIELMYDASEKEWLPSTGGIVWNDYDAIRFGKIASIYNGHMKYAPEDGSNEKVYKCPAKYFLVDAYGNSAEVTEASAADIVIGASDVVFYDNYDRCRWIAIYK